MTARSELTFHKMHGAGNDFVLLDRRNDSRNVDAELARRLADRRFGIGCDQILVLRPPATEGSLARYEILNADGSAAGQCGNGARCIALFLAGEDETGDRPFTLDSPSGPVRVERCADGEFQLDMGVPVFEPERIPLSLTPADGRYAIDSPFGELRFHAASMGNPHALIRVDEIASAPVDTVGPWLGGHPVFPDGCNIGFAEVRDRRTVHLRVFERGAGETPACGSGACAAAAMLHANGLVDETVDVFLPGGHLVIKWPAEGRLTMKGPATHVFRGTMIDE